MTDQLRFDLPASFVLARALPTPAELAYGYQDGWLRRADVVEIAVEKTRRGVSLTPPEEELVLLLADDLDRVDELTADLEIADQPTEDRARLWLFLSLAWLWERREEFTDPLETIEVLYAEFDYPEEISGLVRYMPPPPGEPTGVDAIEQRWRAYLERSAAMYEERSAASAG